MGEDGMNESDDLQRFPQTHTMRQDGATALIALLHALDALHHAVVHELDSFHLMRLQVLANASGKKRHFSKRRRGRREDRRRKLFPAANSPMHILHTIHSQQGNPELSILTT